MTKIILVCFALITSLALAAQTSITGTVVDEQNNPVPYASISIKNTKTGTQADANGHFTITVSTGQTLTVSAVNYTAQEVQINGTSPLTVQLKSAEQTLNEVVVTALGIKREKRQLTYSTQEVTGQTLVQAKQDNIVNGLAGKVAGVQISNSSGMAGSSSRITIRGNVSLLQDNQPLFVVDGVPIDNSEPGGIDVFSQGANNTALNQGSTSNRAIDIDPSIIESITVLKGGAATALYGASAARGAILITT